jgi:hypothetical protein
MRAKPTYLLLALFICLSTKGVVRAGERVFSLSSSLLSRTAQIGSPVDIKLKLTNVTDHAVTFFDKNVDCDYSAEIHDDRGASVRETEYKRQLKCDAGDANARNILVRLQPQESRDEQITLTRFYELSRSGRYTVQAIRKVPKELGGGTVKSNAITLTINE